LGDVRQGIAENPACVSPRVNRRFGDRWKPGTGVFVLSDREVQGLGLSATERALLRPYLQLADWGRYRLAARASRWLIYSTAQTCPDIERFPRLEEHLRRFRPIMEARRETRIGRRGWWQLHWPREEAVWLAPKILCRQMAARPGFVPTLGPAYVSFSANVFVPSPGREEHLYYWAALLNSRLLENWFAGRAKRRGVGLEINGHLLRETPLRPVDFADGTDRRRHDRLVELVGRRLSGSDAEPPEGTGGREQDPIEREIEALVCQGYGR
jgi:adenine-specific DNA-methyltransferase